MPESPRRSVTVLRVRNRMIGFYGFIMAVSWLFIAFAMFGHFRKTSSASTADQTSALALRTASAIDSFCENAEADCSRALRDPIVSDFDPIAKSYPDYRTSALKNEIRRQLLDLAAGKNYNDFFLLFSDSAAIGKVSASGDNYIIRSGSDGVPLPEDGSSDSWVFSPSGRSRKIYYVRRMTDHSRFVLSCYTDELEPFILSTEKNSRTAVILTDSDGTVILANTDHLKDPLTPQQYISLFTYSDEQMISGRYSGTAVTAACGWRIYAVAENPMFIKDTGVYSAVIGLFILSAVTLSFFVGLAAAAKYSSSDINEPNSEYSDPVTGRLNEYGLDEKISELLETSLVGSTYAFIVIGIKDADMIMKSVSTSYRRSIIMKIISISERYFADRSYYIGRISGDRIVLFVEFSEFDLFKAHARLEADCKNFGREFSAFTADTGSALKLNISIGVSIYPDSAEDYDSLLGKALEAFLAAENEGGSSTVIYQRVGSEKTHGEGEKSK